LRRYGRWSALWASFYSRDLYRQVVTEWKGIGILYLMLLLAICWLPSATRWVRGLQGFAATEGTKFVKQLPTVTIQNGVMTATPPGRHVIRLEGDEGRPGQPVFIIDDSIDSIPSDPTFDGFILTRREAAVLQPSKRERRVYTLTPAADMNATPDDVDGFIRSMAVWVPPIMYLLAVAGALVFRVVQSLLYGIVAMTYARRHRVELTHASAMRLASVAVTPVVVIRTLMWFGTWEPAWYLRWPVAVLITFAYIAFGIRALTASSRVEGPAGL